MTGEHYFSAAPTGDERRRPVAVVLRGRPLTLSTASGVFSGDGLDAGTAVLLDAVPAPPATGVLLDLGSGWGPIAIALALESPDAVVWAVDVNERARSLTAANAEAAGVVVTSASPQDIPEATRFDAIWSNPPIRIGKTALHELLETWLPRLAPGGTAYLVVAKQLGAESLERWLAARFPAFGVRRYAQAKGYRVLEVAATVTPAGSSTPS